MSNAITIFGGKQLPAHLQNLELDATTKSLAGNTSAGKRISIKGSVFRMIVDGKQVAENEDRQMNIVVVAAAPSINRQYYAEVFNEDKIVSPACWSADGRTPSADAEQPQSTTCDNCPQNIAGSGQGESRACRYQQRLAVVLEGDISGAVYQLAVPATSLFGKGEVNNTKLPLQAYARHLAQNGLPITSVVTEMKFDTKSATPKLTFRPVRPLDETEFQTAQEQGSSNDATEAITMTVFKTDTKNQSKAKIAVDSEVAAEVEPKKAPTVSKPTPTVKKPVAAVIADWDE